MITTLLKTFLLPPALQLAMFALGALLWRRAKVTAVTLVLLAWFSLLLLSLPALSYHLLRWLEAPYLGGVLVDNRHSEAGAIVVLGAGRQRNSPEYGEDQVSYHGMWRLRYGAHLARQLPLPVVVSGGLVRPYNTRSEAAIGGRLLRVDLGVSNPVWLEEESRNTWENAQYTAALLADKNIKTVILVTHAYHMRRAQLSFEHFGLEVIPMATGFLGFSGSGWWDGWLPDTTSLYRSRIALHESMGLLAYSLKGF